MMAEELQNEEDMDLEKYRQIGDREATSHLWFQQLREESP